MQVLNAIEAKSFFGLGDAILCILDTGLFPRSRFDRIVSMNEWGSVIFLDVRYRFTAYDFGKKRPENVVQALIEVRVTLDQLRRHWLVDRLARKLGQAETVLLGGYRDGINGAMQHFVNRVGCRNVVLLDDGTDTILVNEQRRRPRIQDNGAHCQHPRSRGFLKAIRSTLRRKFVDWDTTPVESLTFFSCYDLDVRQGDRFMRNEYRVLRASSKSLARSDDVVFLGQPLTQDSFMKPEKYVDYLRRVKKYVAPRRLLYVPHPRESNESIESVQTQLGVEVRVLDVPAEYYFAAVTRPACVVSFFTSALENCTRILGDALSVKAVYLEAGDLLRGQDEIEKIYQYFENRQSLGFEVIRV